MTFEKQTPKADTPRVRWFSCARVWRKCWVLGIGVGAQDTPFLMIQFGQWLIVIGRHYPTPKGSV